MDEVAATGDPRSPLHRVAEKSWAATSTPRRRSSAETTGQSTGSTARAKAPDLVPAQTRQPTGRLWTIQAAGQDELSRTFDEPALCLDARQAPRPDGGQPTGKGEKLLTSLDRDDASAP